MVYRVYLGSLSAAFSALEPFSSCAAVSSLVMPLVDMTNTGHLAINYGIQTHAQTLTFIPDEEIAACASHSEFSCSIGSKYQGPPLLLLRPHPLYYEGRVPVHVPH